MTLDRKFRGWLEENIDVFINDPRTYVKIARNRPTLSKNLLDFVMGYFYAELIGDAKFFSVVYKIPSEDSSLKEVWELLDRRSHEIADAVQRELERTT